MGPQLSVSTCVHPLVTTGHAWAILSCYVIHRYTQCLAGSAISDLALRLSATGLTCEMGRASGMPVPDLESKLES